MINNRSYGSGPLSHPLRQSLILMAMVMLALLAFATTAYAHAVTEGDKGYIQEVSGMKLIPFMYLGAKHMVTGYDHLLFLFGVVFFLYKMKHVAIYVSLFAIGHSTTMLAGSAGWMRAASPASIAAWPPAESGAMVRVNASWAGTQMSAQTP